MRDFDRYIQAEPTADMLAQWEYSEGHTKQVLEHTSYSSVSLPVTHGRERFTEVDKQGHETVGQGEVSRGKSPVHTPSRGRGSDEAQCIQTEPAPAAAVLVKSGRGKKLFVLDVLSRTRPPNVHKGQHAFAFLFRTFYHSKISSIYLSLVTKLQESWPSYLEESPQTSQYTSFVSSVQ
jgi:hypothetical protein